MSTTTIAGGVQSLPRQRHLRSVPAFGSEDRPRSSAGAPALDRAPSRGAAAPGPLRLTRRGRAVVMALRWSAVTLVAGLAVLLGVLVLSDAAEAGGAPAVPVPAAEHVVLPGETLWRIASAWAPEEDPREAIAEIVDFNGLPGVGIVAGQKIMLPQRG